MTGLQVYVLVLPLIVAAIGWGVALWWVKRSDHEDHGAKQPGSR
jgi:hypothetical protein